MLKEYASVMVAAGFGLWVVDDRVAKRLGPLSLSVTQDTEAVQRNTKVLKEIGENLELIQIGLTKVSKSQESIREDIEKLATTQGRIQAQVEDLTSTVEDLSKRRATR